jgi:hypothetical protein
MQLGLSVSSRWDERIRYDDISMYTKRILHSLFLWCTFRAVLDGFKYLAITNVPECNNKCPQLHFNCRQYNDVCMRKQDTIRHVVKTERLRKCLFNN